VLEIVCDQKKEFELVMKAKPLPEKTSPGLLVPDVVLFLD